MVAPPPEPTGLSRRRFLALSGSTVGALILAACGRSAGVTGGGGNRTTVAGSEPGQDVQKDLLYSDEAAFSDIIDGLPSGGRLRLGLAEQIPTTLDVLVGVAGGTFWAADPAHDFLERFDHTTTIAPALAESVEQVDDVTVRFHLREGVRFHNGAEVTAEDVKKTIDWVKDPANGSSYLERLTDVTVEVIDPMTAEFRLDAPNAGLRANLTDIPIVPVDEADKQATNPIGCGPFIFREWVRDAHVEWEANPDYWQEGLPALDSLRIQHFADSNAAAQAFLAGQLDAVIPVPTAQAPAFREREAKGEIGIHVVENGVTYITTNLKKEPYTDPKVRQAIRLAIDREEMASAPFNGLARPLYFLGIVPENPLYPTRLEYKRDVDRARQLMEEAGFADGFNDRILTPDFDYFQGIATIAQSNLAEIGIELELEVVDVSTAIARLYDERDFTIAVLGEPLNPEPVARVDRYVRSDGGGNFFGYASEEADRLLAEARSTYDTEERRKLYEQAFEQVFITDTAIIPVTTEPFFGAYRLATNFPQYGPTADRWKYPVAAIEQE